MSRRTARRAAPARRPSTAGSDAVREVKPHHRPGAWPAPMRGLAALSRFLAVARGRGHRLLPARGGLPGDVAVRRAQPDAATTCRSSARRRGPTASSATRCSCSASSAAPTPPTPAATSASTRSRACIKAKQRAWCCASLTTLAALAIVAHASSRRRCGSTRSRCEEAGEASQAEQLFTPARGAMIIVDRLRRHRVPLLRADGHRRRLAGVQRRAAGGVDRRGAPARRGETRRDRARRRRPATLRTRAASRASLPLSSASSSSRSSGCRCSACSARSAWPACTHVGHPALGRARRRLRARRRQGGLAVDDPAVHLRRLPDGARQDRAAPGAHGGGAARLDPGRPGAHDAVDLRVLHRLHRRLGRHHRRARRPAAAGAGAVALLQALLASRSSPARARSACSSRRRCRSSSTASSSALNAGQAGARPIEFSIERFFVRRHRPRPGAARHPVGLLRRRGLALARCRRTKLDLPKFCKAFWEAKWELPIPFVDHRPVDARASPPSPRSRRSPRSTCSSSRSSSTRTSTSGATSSASRASR